ncbi:hypothetical protein SERLA73DRAFT_175968 [Serpula lacrymans var. lacrymans S7.3]|uniref:SYO1-like TPR repeats domain-containing protein n=2 Tax=Serpula lacrymans var. lacrymans TaxID=341189 RepID=F8PLM9_SERL3|nr:uncharacterized protein SERLADRAFT_458658 [Serpula lacrymans var. lacrymans S7.9]EGO02511.1 hypothetical protein SERLA73DRAFT_175968 [Serpula lacrymans var. lacrymans S7.3]EGO28245.1 hypothetical protein SERLADRAFT_458658 [Serpula lacrymans var. lacrymans S7.9]
MGKSQKKRSQRRYNPVRVLDSYIPKGLASAASSSSKNEAILPIIQKMQSADGAERKWACVAVSNLIQNDASTRRLLQGKDIVGYLITRLSDSEEEVWIEAAGALRNLCIDGGHEICAEMFNKNILAPLKTFVPKMSTILSQFLGSPKTAPEMFQKVVYEFAENVITIFWCLSETSNKALSAINQMNLTAFLMSFLASRDQLPIATATAAAQCLYVLTDDNQPTIDEIRSNVAYSSCLLDIARSGGTTNGKGENSAEGPSVMFKILVAGILRNISPLPPPSTTSAADIDKTIVLPLLEPVLSSVNLLEAISFAQDAVTRESSEPQIGNLSSKHMPKSDHKTPDQFELDRLENKLRIVLLTLEVLTGTCAMLPDPVNLLVDGNNEIIDDDSQDETMDDGPDVQIADVPAPQSSFHPNFLPSLVPPLLALIHPTPLSFPPSGGLSVHPPMTFALGSIHICALECLNNVFLSLGATPNPTLVADKESGRKVWEDIWITLRAVGTDIGPGQETKQDMWDIAVGVLWGVGNIWKGSLVPCEDQVKVLTQLCDTSEDPKIRVKCIGTLECLAQYPDTLDANRSIAEYLLSIISTPATPFPAGTEPLIQALSAIVDIYSDESMPYDVNFRQGQYADRLVASLDSVIKVVRGVDKQKDSDLRLRGEEVRDNLIAFIDYRRKLSL